MKGRKPTPQGLKPASILLDFYGMAEAMPFQNTAQTEFVNILGTTKVVPCYKPSPQNLFQQPVKLYPFKAVPVGNSKFKCDCSVCKPICPG